MFGAPLPFSLSYSAKSHHVTCKLRLSVRGRGGQVGGFSKGVLDILPHVSEPSGLALALYGYIRGLY